MAVQKGQFQTFRKFTCSEQRCIHMSATAIRGKDWVFNAFWAACGENNAPKCLVNIPVTTIIKDGKPFKTLWTDGAGVVRRIILEDIPVERAEVDKGFRGDSLRTIRAMRKVLLDYCLNNGYIQIQEENGQDPLICNVSAIRPNK